MLPGKHEWTLEEAGKHGNAMIACVTGPFQKRKVKHALESSRTTAIGVEIPVEEPTPPPVKPKRTVNLKVASTSSTPAPIAPAEAKKPAAAEEAKDEEPEVKDKESDPGSGDEKPLLDSMDAS